MVGPGVAEEIVVRFEEEEGMLMTPESWCARREEGWRAGGDGVGDQPTRTTPIRPY